MIAFDAVFVALLVAVVLAIVAYGVVVVRTAALEGAAFESPLARRRGSAELGRVAFLAHRLSGFAILAFLALHILDIGLDGVSTAAYDRVQHLYGSAPLRVFECGLLFAILFHTGNGLRLLAFDLFGLSPRWSRRLLVAAVAVCAAAGLAGSVLILRPLFA